MSHEETHPGRLEGLIRETTSGLDEIIALSRRGGGGEAPERLERVWSLAQGLRKRLRAAQGAETQVPPRLPLEGLRILAVDDLDLNRVMLRLTLGRGGALAAIVADGPEALALLAERRFDLALLDLDMPGMDGFELARRIRGDLGLRDLPVIAVSSMEGEERRRQCLEAGMDDILSRPFNLEELASVVRPHLGVRLDTAWAAPAPSGSRPVIPEVAGIDAEGALRRLDGATEVYKRLLAAFMESHAEAPFLIRRHLERGDSRDAVRLAHAVKGLASSLGGVHLAEAARAVEASARGGEVGGGALDRLEGAHAEFTGSARALLTALAGVSDPSGPREPVTDDGRPLPELVRELRRLLSEGSLRAEECLARIKRRYAGNALPPALAAVEGHLAGLDMDRALDALGALDPRDAEGPLRTEDGNG